MAGERASNAYPGITFPVIPGRPRSTGNTQIARTQPSARSTFSARRSFPIVSKESPQPWRCAAGFNACWETITAGSCGNEVSLENESDGDRATRVGFARNVAQL